MIVDAYVVYCLSGARVEVLSRHMSLSAAEAALTDRRNLSLVEIFVGPGAVIKHGMPVTFARPALNPGFNS
jgi:hypothetical protein